MGKDGSAITSSWVVNEIRQACATISYTLHNPLAWALQVAPKQDQSLRCWSILANYMPEERVTSPAAQKAALGVLLSMAKRTPETQFYCLPFRLQEWCGRDRTFLRKAMCNSSKTSWTESCICDVHDRVRRPLSKANKIRHGGSGAADFVWFSSVHEVIVWTKLYSNYLRAQYWVVFEKKRFSILLMFDFPLHLLLFSIFTSSKLLFYWAKQQKWNTDMHSEFSKNLFQYKCLFRQEEI